VRKNLRIQGVCLYGKAFGANTNICCRTEHEAWLMAPVAFARGGISGRRDNPTIRGSQSDRGFAPGLWRAISKTGCAVF